MGAVAVLHPQDVLKDRSNYNRQPLVSPSNSSMKSRGGSPKLIPNSAPNPNFIADSNPNPNFVPKSYNRRKRSPQKKTNNSLSKSPPNNSHLVMGEVKILKRGEDLASVMASSKEDKGGLLTKKIDENQKVCEAVLATNCLEVLSTTERSAPEPEMILKQICRADFYAGSAFVSSPSPSSLPLPAFLRRNR